MGPWSLEPGDPETRWIRFCALRLRAASAINESGSGVSGPTSNLFRRNQNERGLAFAAHISSSYASDLEAGEFPLSLPLVAARLLSEGMH